MFVFLSPYICDVRSKRKEKRGRENTSSMKPKEKTLQTYFNCVWRWVHVYNMCIVYIDKSVKYFYRAPTFYWTKTKIIYTKYKFFELLMSLSLLIDSTVHTIGYNSALSQFWYILISICNERYIWSFFPSPLLYSIQLFIFENGLRWCPILLLHSKQKFANFLILFRSTLTFRLCCKMATMSAMDQHTIYQLKIFHIFYSVLVCRLCCIFIGNHDQVPNKFIFRYFLI